MQEDQASLGSLLRQNRESKKLTQQQVADRLRLSVAKIQALESEQRELMTTDLARGYLRQYARVLQMDEQQLLDLHSQLFPTQQQQIHLATEALKKSATHQQSIQKFTLFSLLVIVSILVLSFALYQWNVTQEDDSNGSQASTASSNTVGDDSAENPSIDKEKLEAEVKQQEQKPESAVNASGQSRPSKAGQVEIKFVFSEQSWTSVRDGQGNSIYNKLAEAGTQDVVYGTPPLKLIIGNVHGTQLFAHGEQISLEKYMQNNVARLNVV